jgi:uncharacterized protein HemX
MIAFGGGIKFMLSRTDQNNKDERAWQEKERAKLEAAFQAQIAGLVSRIENSNEEVRRMRSEIAGYQRHLGRLEGLLRANGVDFPPLPLPGGE